MHTADLVTSKTVARHFGVSISTVNRWVREERIPYVRPSRRIVRFRLDDIERALGNCGASAAEADDV